MMFSELYGAYYNAVARIIAKATSGQLTKREMQRIASETAFSESALEICPALCEGQWQLVCPDMSTPIKNPPSMPMTLIQKRWLKAVLMDKRIKLFDIKIEGLEDVAPLFCPESYVVFDKYSDGDDYDDEDYIRHFRLIVKAIGEDLPLQLNVVNRRGNKIMLHVKPKHLEYSEKDDKFRLITEGNRRCGTVNLSRIISCKPYYGDVDRTESLPKKTGSLVLCVRDERNALERAMLHFAHFEKKAERIGDNEYRLTLSYDVSDETELLIRVLSFGPLVRVVSPEGFAESLRKRIEMQKQLLDKREVEKCTISE